MEKYTVGSPFGDLTYSIEQGALVALDWYGGHAPPTAGLPADVALQLDEYFHHGRQSFDLPMAGFTSDFAKRFADAMCAIPFGDTQTYGEIAAVTGVSAQTAGQACGANRIPIIIPCHRVMGAKGLVGYSGAGGVETKVALLRHEGAGGFLI